MDLPYVLKLLVAAGEQPYGFIKLYGEQADFEVRLMVEAGLVEATLNDGQSGSFTSINRVTDLGETFVRVFPDRSIPVLTPLSPLLGFPSQSQPRFSTAEIAQRKVKFAVALRCLEEAAA